MHVAARMIARIATSLRSVANYCFKDSATDKTQSCRSTDTVEYSSADNRISIVDSWVWIIKKPRRPDARPHCSSTSIVLFPIPRCRLHVHVTLFRIENLLISA